MGTEIDDLKKGVADIGNFMRDKYDPMITAQEANADEMKAMREDISGILDAQRTANRNALLKRTEDSVRRIMYRSASGETKIMADQFDLMLLRKFQVRTVTHAAEQGNAEKMLVAQKWGENLGMYEKAMDSTTAGAGDELVPTNLDDQLWMDIHLATSVTSLFERITMPTNPFDIPLDLGDVNWFPGTANTAATSTDLATAQRTLTAKELVAVVPWSLDLDEDAVIAMLPTVRATIVRNAAEVMDDVVLNADTTTTNNINADGATISTSTAGKAQELLGWDGLRHIPLVDNTGQGNDHSAGVTDDMFNEIRAKLDKYGVRPSETAWICDLNTFIRAQSISNMRTLDKFGPQATIFTGQLAAVEGIPLIVSEQLLLADTDGKVTSGGNVTDTGTLLIVNRSQYRTGFKRELTIEVERDIQKRQTVMVASFRMAFDGRNTNSSDTAVAMQFDVTGVS